MNVIEPLVVAFSQLRANKMRSFLTTLGILIGVGANPCAVEPERELQHYLNKINAGAECSRPCARPLACFDSRCASMPDSIVPSRVWAMRVRSSRRHRQL